MGALVALILRALAYIPRSFLRFFVWLGNAHVFYAVLLRWFLRAAFLVIIPLAMLKGFNSILGMIVELQLENMAEVGSVPGLSFGQFSGMFLYLYVQLGLNIALASMISALSWRFLMRLASTSYSMMPIWWVR